MDNTTAFLDRWSQAMLPAYTTPQLVFSHGQGPYLFDVDQRRYLDFLAGIAVNILGHAHPAIINAVVNQVSTLGHTSNLYANIPSITLAERLLTHTNPHAHMQVFFTNSGTEANEAAFKITRLTGKTHLVAAQEGFHGRTMGALALTGQPSKQDPFRPLPGQISFVPYGDIDALAQAVTDQTAAVFLEPILGEAGVIVPPPGYLTAARDITTQHKALLVIDEVQTGMGRTGRFYAHQHEDITPDIITMAKGIAAGLPMGACLVAQPTASLMKPGLHGSTFAGNPICAAAALAVLDTLEDDNLITTADHLGTVLHDGILALEHPLIAHVRGRGLLIGIAFTDPIAYQVRTQAQQAGFLINATSPTVIRLAPPLIITVEHINEFLTTLSHILDTIKVDL